MTVLTSDDKYAVRLRDVFAVRRDLLRQALTGIPGVRLEGGDGAFYLWLDVSAFTPDDVLFCRRLLSEQGVALTPGCAFLAPGYVRIAYTKDAAILSEAAHRLVQFCKSF